MSGGRRRFTVGNRLAGSEACKSGRQGCRAARPFYRSRRFFASHATLHCWEASPKRKQRVIGRPIRRRSTPVAFAAFSRSLKQTNDRGSLDKERPHSDRFGNRGDGERSLLRSIVSAQPRRFAGHPPRCFRLPNLERLGMGGRQSTDRDRCTTLRHGRLEWPDQWTRIHKNGLYNTFIKCDTFLIVTYLIGI